jgi:outer membrane protein assembly factor BamB
VLDSGAVYAGFAGGKLVAIRADNGKLIWEATVAQPKGVTEIERIADITSLPVVDGPLVYAVAYQGKIAAVDRASGRVVWNRDISSYSGLNAEDAKIFVSHTLGAVYSLEYTTGKTFWRQGALANRRLTAPLPMGNVIAVGDLEGYLHFLTREEGKFAARIKLDSNPVMSLVAGTKSNQLIAETREGGLYAISVAESNVKPSASPVSKPEPESRPEPATEKTQPEAAPDQAPSASEPAAEPSTERSILFQKNDSILLPDVETAPAPNSNNSAPGIRLPSPEQ